MKTITLNIPEKMVKEESKTIEIARIVLDVNRYNENDGAITIIPSVGQALVFDKLNISDLIETCANKAASQEEGMSTSVVEEAPVEGAPVEEAPVEEAPVEEAPVEEAPVEEAPVEEAVSEEIVLEESEEETEAPTLE